MPYSSLKRYTPLKRSRMKHKGPSKAARVREFKASVRQEIKDRSCGICEICRQHEAVHIHHVVYRSHQGGGNIENGLHLCNACHAAVHATEAMRRHAEYVAAGLVNGEVKSNRDLFMFMC